MAPDHDQASVDEHSQLEVDAFRRPQPVKVSQHRCDVLVPRRTVYQSGGGIKHRLKSTKLGRRKPSECCIAIVKTNIILCNNQCALRHDSQHVTTSNNFKDMF